MSSVVKAVKKVFKKVVKVVKKIAPVILGVAALVFTGGAALGLTGIMGGGWSAAAASVSSSLGATGVLGSALTGAITQAGTGALIGGAIAGVTGGSVSQGMKAGAQAGAVTGGLLGAYSGIRQPAAGSAKTYAMPEGGTMGTGEAIDASGAVVGPGATAPIAGVPPAVNTSKGLLSAGGWLERNQELAGGLMKGVGSGLLAGANADAEGELLTHRQNLISNNYRGTDPGAKFRDVAPGTSTQTPTDRFNPSQYGSFEYQYDPKVGRIVRVPVGG